MLSFVLQISGQDADDIVDRVAQFHVPLLAYMRTILAQSPPYPLGATEGLVEGLPQHLGKCFDSPRCGGGSPKTLPYLYIHMQATKTVSRP